jgi:hypothetical protein
MEGFGTLELNNQRRRKCGNQGEILYSVLFVPLKVFKSQLLNRGLIISSTFFKIKYKTVKGKGKKSSRFLLYFLM